MARKRYKPEESLNANGGSATEQQCHFVRALRSNGQERASGERHAVESDHDPLQSPYAPKREPAQPAVEGDFAISGDAALHVASEGFREYLDRRAADVHEPSGDAALHVASEGFREYLDRRAADVHEPSFFSRDANGDHERSEQERHPAESDNVISLALGANGQECASVERHAVEDDQDPLQSPYAPKREPAQPAVEGDFAEDATHRESEGLREHLERRAIDINEPSLFSHDATGGGQQELERLAASVRVERHAVESDHDPLQSPYAPKKEPAQPAVEGDFAEDATHRESEGLHEHLERRAIEELERLAASVRVERHAVESDHDPLQSPYAPKKEPAQPAVEGDFAEDATHRESEGLREHLERRAIDIHEPSLFSHDATGGGQQEFERLAANVRAVQREEAAARLPRAAQLASVPGLAPADSGFGPPPSLETEDLAPSPVMGSRPDRLRGPFTIINISILIVSIFAVPAAYYFWVGGWDPISNLPPERASFVPNSIMPPPMPSSQAATTIARDDDPGTPAKGEPRTAKSFADETVATLQPSTPGAQDPPSSTVVRPLASNSIVPPPKPSTQAATTPAQGEPPTAKSFAGETVATLEPGTPGAQDPPSSTAVRPLVSNSIVSPPKPSSQAATTPAQGEPPTAKSFVGETVATLESGTPSAQDPPSSTAVRPLVSNSIVPPPMPSSQAATTIARDDDPGTPAKDEPRTAKSFAGERLATLLPGALVAQDPSSSRAVRPLDAEQIKFLMKHGEQFIAAGDVVTARLAFQRAAEADDANAAVALGATYDPTVLAKIGVAGIRADVAEARSWYQKAEKLGSPEARRRLEVLADR